MDMEKDPDIKTPAESIPDMFREAWKPMAQAMYEAYGDSVDWKAVSGHPMPTFAKVGERVEGAWCIAAERASRYLVESTTVEQFMRRKGQ